jgi:hypothetical protein
VAAAVGLGGFALFGLLTGLVFRSFFRGRRLGLGRLILLTTLLNAVALYGLVLSAAVFTIGPDDVGSDVERAVLKIGAWPAFAVVALWAYSRRTRTRVISQRIVSTPGVVLVQPPISGVQSAQADGPPLPPPPPAPLPQPF